MSYGIEIKERVCEVCLQPLLTTSSRKKTHDTCRVEYYRRYHRSKYVKKYGFKITKTRAERNRSYWHVNTHECAVAGCGYKLITREMKLRKDGEVVKVNLCPQHWAEHRLGFLESWTWKRIDMVEAKIAKEVEAAKALAQADERSATVSAAPIHTNKEGAADE